MTDVSVKNNAEGGDDEQPRPTAAPKCPTCGASGTENIVSTPSEERSKHKQPWFYIIHCAACGHIYNTITKHQFNQQIQPKLILPRPD